MENSSARCGAAGHSTQSFGDLFTRADRRLAANTVLFREGEMPDGVYLLQSGEVDLVHEHAATRTARAGEILGLSAVISGRTHLSTAVARTPAAVAFIGCEELRALVDDNPPIWFSVLRQLSQDVNASYDAIRRFRNPLR
ncbi:MAG TPA: cyclic nucleotide-binding domain-containing protein [Thermoanaerobaculia bacterium]|jgi:CRP-like cAMP-binding protein